VDKEEAYTALLGSHQVKVRNSSSVSRLELEKKPLLQRYAKSLPTEQDNPKPLAVSTKEKLFSYSVQ
jgi:hypothetical protein